MIHQLFFYVNGSLAALLDNGDQCPVESEPWYVPFLSDLLERGLADDRTMVSIPGFFSGPLLGLRNTRCPLPVARGENPRKLAAIAFYPNGKTACVGIDGGANYELARPWYLPSVEGKLKRGVVQESTRVVVPNAFFGTIRELLDQQNARESAIQSRKV